MSDTESPSPAIEVADVLRRMPGLIRAAAKYVELGDEMPASTILELAGGFKPDRELVAAACSLLSRFAGYAGFDAKDLEDMAVTIERKTHQQPWRRS